MANEVAEIEYVDSPVKSHKFTLSFFTSDILFEVVKIGNSTFVWIGDMQHGKFMDLSYAIPSTSDNTSTPVSTKILGIGSTSSISQLMSGRLSKKLKKPVYVSFNNDIDQKELLEKIEERLTEEIGLNSEFF